jgi:hypothetical protein
MKFSMKHTEKAHSRRKSLYTATWGVCVGKQKFPESVEFVPHSHFFLIKLHEEMHEGESSILRTFMSDVSQTDLDILVNSPH